MNTMEIIPTKVVEKKEFPTIEDGVYQGTLVEVESEKGTIKNNGKDKEVDVCFLYFDVKYKEDKESVKLRFRGYLPATEGNKLGKALIALGYKDFTKELLVKTLIDTKASVFVEQYATKDKEGKDIVRNIITKIKPLIEEEIVA